REDVGADVRELGAETCRLLEPTGTRFVRRDFVSPRYVAALGQRDRDRAHPRPVRVQPELGLPTVDVSAPVDPPGGKSGQTGEGSRRGDGLCRENGRVVRPALRRLWDRQVVGG